MRVRREFLGKKPFFSPYLVFQICCPAGGGSRVESCATAVAGSLRAAAAARSAHPTPESEPSTVRLQRIRDVPATMAGIDMLKARIE